MQAFIQKTHASHDKSAVRRLRPHKTHGIYNTINFCHMNIMLTAAANTITVAHILKTATGLSFFQFLTVCNSIRIPRSICETYSGISVIPIKCNTAIIIMHMLHNIANTHITFSTLFIPFQPSQIIILLRPPVYPFVCKQFGRSFLISFVQTELFLTPLSPVQFAQIHIEMQPSPIASAFCNISI